MLRRQSFIASLLLLALTLSLSLPARPALALEPSAPAAPSPYPAITQVLAGSNMVELKDGSTLPRATGDISLSFNRAMDPTSLAGAISLQDSQGRSPRWVLGGAGAQFALNLQEPLQRNETYTLSVKGGPTSARDSNGEPLHDPVTLTFKTDGAPAPFTIRTRTSWDLAGVRQFDLFPLDADAGKLTLQLPLNPLREVGLSETFNVQVLRVRPQQPVQIIYSGRFDYSQQTLEVTLPQAGSYQVVLSPKYVGEPQPDRRLSVAASYLDRWPGPSAPIVPSDSLHDLTAVKAPFDWVFGQPPALFKWLAVGIDGKVQTVGTLQPDRAIRVDPTGLASGLHTLTAVTPSADSGNLAFINRRFLSRQADSFTDVPASHWAYGQIEVMSQLDILNGRGAGHYEPNLPVKRGEFAKILAKTLKLPLSAQDSVPFVDVPSGEWYKPYVAALAKQGLIRGETVDGQVYFRPERTISRQEAATIIARALGVNVSQVTAGTIVFSDASDVQVWARPSVQALVSLKWTAGFPDGSFRPADNLNRDQAAKLISRFLEL